MVSLAQRRTWVRWAVEAYAVAELRQRPRQLVRTRAWPIVTGAFMCGSTAKNGPSITSVGAATRSRREAHVAAQAAEGPTKWATACDPHDLRCGATSAG